MPEKTEFKAVKEADVLTRFSVMQGMEQAVGVPADIIKNTAMEKFKSLAPGSGNTTSQLQQLNSAASLAAVAAVALVKTYELISDKLDSLERKRLRFDEQVKGGLATFNLPTHKIETKFSLEEALFKTFIKSVEKINPDLRKYLGFKASTLKQNPEYLFYSALPNYSWSTAFADPLASMRGIDRERTLISLFLKTEVVHARGKIIGDFYDDSTPPSFFRSIYQKKNYLNDRYLSLFIMTTLANLLWSLQRPIDVSTGIPLSVDGCIRLCDQSLRLLNALLLPDSSLYKLNDDMNEIVSYVRKVNSHIRQVYLAYLEKKVHEFSITDLVNTALTAQHTAGTSICKIIFPKRNTAISYGEEEYSPASALAYCIGYLNTLLQTDNSILSFFRSEALLDYLPPNTWVNDPILTIMDAVIIFSHVPSNERLHLIKQIKASGGTCNTEFAITLAHYDKAFLQRVDTMSYSACDGKAVSVLTGRCMLPIVALTVRDHRVKLDSVALQTDITVAQKRCPSHLIKTSAEQIDFICRDFVAGDGHYKLKVSLFASVDSIATDVLDSLPKKQFRLIQINELFDGIRELTTHYQSFLQYKNFQQFLLNFLGKLKEEFSELSLLINQQANQVTIDDGITGSLKEILWPMIDKLKICFDDFSLAAKDFERTVRTPEFTMTQRSFLSSKVHFIEEGYTQLFGEEALGLTQSYAMINKEGLLPQTEFTDEKKPRLTSFEFSDKALHARRDKILEYISGIIDSKTHAEALKKPENHHESLTKAVGTRGIIYEGESIPAKKAIKWLVLIDKSLNKLCSVPEDKRTVLTRDDITTLLQHVALKGERSTSDVKTSSFCKYVIDPLDKLLVKHKAMDGLHSKPTQVATALVKPASGSVSPRIDSDFTVKKQRLKSALETYVQVREALLPLRWYQCLYRIIVKMLGYLFARVKRNTRETKLSAAKQLLKKIDGQTITLQPHQLHAFDGGKLKGYTRAYRQDFLFWNQVTVQKTHATADALIPVGRT